MGTSSSLADWAAETAESITARLEGAKTAQVQTRRTLVLMAIISMMMLIACYNAYLSYDSVWVLGLTKRQLAEGKFVSDVLTNQALRDWASSRSALVSLLGLRISVDDAPVLGTASLAVMSLWLLMLSRRENQIVGFLLRDTDTTTKTDSGVVAWSRLEGTADNAGEANGLRWLIYHTLMANSPFPSFDHSLSPVKSLDRSHPRDEVPRRGILGWSQRTSVGFVRGFFFLMPPAACLFVFALDRRSYVQPDAFAIDAAVPGIGSPFYIYSMIAFIIGWIPLLLCCWRSRQYSSATDTVLRQYGSRLRRDIRIAGAALAGERAPHHLRADVVRSRSQ